MKMNFKETVEEFDRMCEFYDDETENPFYEETNSNDWEDWWMMAAYEPEKFNELVEKFSHDHPKPIYPTVGELVDYIVPNLYDNYGYRYDWNDIKDLRVPEDKAKELGLTPINECGLTKYEGSEWR
jgi:hypothetical protein